MENSQGYDLFFNPWNEYDDILPDIQECTPIDMRSLKYLAPAKALDHLSCPICKLPFIEPWSTLCGHTFCKECIFESFKSVLGERCPLDRMSLKLSKPIRKKLNEYFHEENDDYIGEQYDPGDNGDDPDKFDDVNDESDIYPAPIILSNMTDDLMVSCLNKSRGCRWTGERWSIKKHLVETCEYTRVLCICGELCERKMLVDDNLLEVAGSGVFYAKSKLDIDTDDFGEDDFSEREDDSCDGVTCPHSNIDCYNCDVTIKKIDFSDHLENHCLKNMFKCSGCHLAFPQMHLKSHKKHCVKIFVDCPGKEFGCTWKGQRELLENIHTDDCVFMKMSGYLNGLNDIVKETKKENESLKLQMSTILDSVVQGKVHNLGYPLEIEEIGLDGEVRNNKIENKYDQINLHISENPELDEPIQGTGPITIPKVRMLIKELEMNKRVTDTLVNENLNLHEQMNNQRAMILNLQQQMQFMMIERRRMFTSKATSSESFQDSKLSTKL